MTTFRTIGKVCDGRWPRLLPLQLAAAYLCETTIDRFRRVKAYRELVFVDNPSGREVVDRYQLDALLDAERGKTTNDTK